MEEQTIQNPIVSQGDHSKGPDYFTRSYKDIHWTRHIDTLEVAKWVGVGFIVFFGLGVIKYTALIIYEIIKAL